jgi:hypothetical protein
MSINPDDLTPDPSDDPDALVQVRVGDLRGMRAKAKANSDAEADRKRAEDAERKLALVVAGVPLDSPRGSMFANAYTGPLTHEDIVKSWNEINGGEAPNPTPEPNPVSVTEAEIQAALDRSRVATGASVESGQAPTKPASQRAVEAALEVMGQGGTQEEAFVRFGQEALVALGQGDRSMTVGNLE